MSAKLSPKLVSDINLNNNNNNNSNNNNNNNSNNSNNNNNIEFYEPIPKLNEILDDEIDPTFTYSKINFLKFLVDKHCIENYDFFTELKSIINNYELFLKHNSTSEWFSIYNQFIETEIVNLPANLTLNLSKNNLPCINLLKKIEKIILNNLLVSYYEFISDNKSKFSTSSCSTTTTNSSNNKTDCSCFTNNLNNSNLHSNSNSHSPDSYSVCSDCSFGLISDDDYLLNNINKINSDIINKCNHNLISNINNENKNNEITINDNKNKNNEINEITNSYNDITLKSNKSSNSSFSNLTVCDQCNGNNCPNEKGKSWSKLTKKLKWRRKSNSSS